MAIPKYHELYGPFLDCLKDGHQHKFKDVKEVVATAMSLTEEERKELLSSGKQAVFDNRIGWTRTHLKKAGLIDSPSRGVFVITAEGRKLLIENPPIINDDFLMRYEGFRSFKNQDISNHNLPEINSSEDTPQDSIDKAFKMINKSLADELLSEIMKQTPSFFEALVVKLL